MCRHADDQYRSPNSHIPRAKVKATPDQAAAGTPSAVAVETPRSRPGVHDLSFVPELAGECELHVLVQRKHIPGSPFSLTVSAGAFSLQHCEYTTGKQSLEAYCWNSLDITARDRFGNRLRVGGARIRGRVSAIGFQDMNGFQQPVLLPLSSRPLDITDLQNGAYCARFWLWAAGMYTFTFCVGDADEDVTHSFDAWAVEPTVVPSRCSVGAADGLELRAGVPGAVRLRILSDRGNELCAAPLGSAVEATFLPRVAALLENTAASVPALFCATPRAVPPPPVQVTGAAPALCMAPSAGKCDGASLGMCVGPTTDIAAGGMRRRGARVLRALRGMRFRHVLAPGQLRRNGHGQLADACLRASFRLLPEQERCGVQRHARGCWTGHGYRRRHDVRALTPSPAQSRWLLRFRRRWPSSFQVRFERHRRVRAGVHRDTAG